MKITGGSMGHQISILDEIIVDNFAGGGGASTGIELALGRPVDIAINHDMAAIAMHKQNHPFTEHYCESVWDVKPEQLCRGRKVALMWLSPDCKHFSKAKGGKPVEKNIRGLAWIALRWAATVKPRVIILENVEEFKTWGRIGEDGRPDPRHKGETFKSFVNALKRHGYQVDYKELKACDYGAPTSRKRFVLVARCDKKPIVFPKPTHAPKEVATANGLKPYRTAAEIIDWSIECPSIFSRKKSLVDATMRRIARGIDKFVINNDKPFIIPIGYGERKGQNPRVHNIDEPLSTVVAGGCKQNLVAPTLTKFNDVSKGQAVDVPLDTVMAGATRFGKVNTMLTPFIQHENYDNVPQSVEKPLSTITTGIHQYIATTKLAPFIEQGFGGNYKGAGVSVDKPLPTVTAIDHNSLAGVTLIQYHSETSKNEVRACQIENPLPTVDTRNRYAVASAFIHKYYAGNYNGAGSSAIAPLDTITVQERHACTMPFMTEYYGTEKDGTPCTEPQKTVMAKNKSAVVTVKLTDKGQNLGHWAEVRNILNKYAGYDLKDDEILLFNICGILYFISDIGMRMLSPRELYDAQGFPHDYKIEFDVNNKPYSKKEQIARCGNAVCPPMAEAVVRANLPEYAVKKKLETMQELKKEMVV